MERLTHIDHLGWYANGRDGERIRGSHIDRLAAYEDTGIDPDELRIIGDIKRFKYEIIFGSKADRLKELSDADNAGRLIVLPCKVGDTVWVVDCEYMDCNNCDHLEHGKYCPYLNKPVCPNGTIRQGRFHYSLIPNFGKTIFLTREEAEAALAGKGGAK